MWTDKPDHESRSGYRLCPVLLGTLLIAIQLGLARAQATPLNCGDFWSDPAILDIRVDSVVPCIEYDPRDPGLNVGPGTDYRLFYPESFDDPNFHPGWQEYITSLAQGLHDAVTHFQTHLRPYPTYVVVLEDFGLARPFDHLSEYDINTFAEERGHLIVLDEPCPVLSYPRLQAQPGEIVKQVMAHEVFHCIQAAHFDERMGSSGASWWIEGAATYFSHKVYPCINQEHGYSVNFNPDMAVYDQVYDSVVFFISLSELSSFGEAGIIDVIRAMPRNARDKRAQRRGLASIPDMQNHFHTFARAYMDNGIPDCPDVMPVTVQLGPTFIVEVTPEFTVETKPFEIGRFQMSLLPGKTYKVEKHNEGPEGKLSWREGVGLGEWQDTLPEQIVTDCEGDSRYQFLFTTAADSDEAWEVTLKFEEDEQAAAASVGCCVETGQHDACLIGTWVADNADPLDWMRSAVPDSVTVEYVEGEASFTLRANGTGRGRTLARQSQGNFAVPANNQEVKTELTVTLDSENESRWSTERGVLHVCPTTETINAKSHMVVTSAAGTQVFEEDIPMENFSPDAIGGGLSVEYRCSGSNMTITNRHVGLPDQIYSYRKTGP